MHQGGPAYNAPPPTDIKWERVRKGRLPVPERTFPRFAELKMPVLILILKTPVLIG